jgi:hypothetical protein
LVGKHIQYFGTLKGVNVPEHNSEGNDPAMIELVITVAEVPVSGAATGP